MGNRGARAGWLWGGFGALLWIPILAGILLSKGNMTGGILGTGLFVIGGGYLVICAPWKHERIPLRRLYAGLVLIILTAAVALSAFWDNGRYFEVKNVYYLVYFIPLLIPVFVFGKKTWTDLHG